MKKVLSPISETKIIEMLDTKAGAKDVSLSGSCTCNVTNFETLCH